MPILDGSAKIFVEKILSAGIDISSLPIKLIKIEKQVTYQEGTKSITIDKSKVASEIDFEIRYKNKIIGNQKNKINIFNDDLQHIFNLEHFVFMKMLRNLKVLD